ncbi:MAG: hypothetical protein AAGH90_02750 [Pseudomonadota bacterium]
MLYQQCTLSNEVIALDESDGFKEVARRTLRNGMAPDSVALSADGSELYFNAHNRLEYWTQTWAEPRSAFYCCDAATLKIKWVIPLAGQTEHFAISPDKRYVYCAHYDRMFVTRVDTQTRETYPIQIASLGGHKVRVSKDGSKVYVGSIVWASLDEIDTASAKFTRRLTFDQNVRPFALSHDGSTCYLQKSRFHGLHVVDLTKEDMEITRTVELPELPDHPAPCEDRYPFTIDHGIEITPDEKYAVILVTTGHYVTILSYPDLEPVKHIPVGQQPSYLIVSKDSKTCYVSCRASDELYVIDLESLDVREVVKIKGRYAQRITADH